MSNKIEKSKNPFLQSLRLTVMTKTLVSTNSIQQEGISKVVSKTIQQVEWEKDPYVKVYKNSQFLNMYEQMSGNACKLIFFILFNNPKESDLVTLEPNKVMSFLGIKSRMTLSKVLQECVDFAYITKYKSHTYWVNPMLLFSGDRIGYFKENAPDKIDVINLTEIQESRSIRKKKDLMEQYECSNYYQLKQKLGDLQIQQLLSGEIKLEDVKLLR